MGFPVAGGPGPDSQVPAPEDRCAHRSAVTFLEQKLERVDKRPTLCKSTEMRERWWWSATIVLAERLQPLPLFLTCSERPSIVTDPQAPRRQASRRTKMACVLTPGTTLGLAKVNRVSILCMDGILPTEPHERASTLLRGQRCVSEEHREAFASVVPLDATRQSVTD